jgi:hypothetical protein
VQVDPVEREDDVGLGQDLTRAFAKNVERIDRMRRMIGREHRAGFQVRHHDRAEALGELDARIPNFLVALTAAHQHHDLLPLFEQRDRFVDAFAGRTRRQRRHKARQVRPLRLLLQL